ncbi:uncharacterized protein LOC122925855 [Bufo gargarizans]|uniref:uncharacterized protein LOC122925855 n=1 Tax=Bufo gargarizans TaxID=30331 RepID=UPI001CF27212|nr:uncharacterized protein LOC122925855 [Bufo gargarizans]
MLHQRRSGSGPPKKRPYMFREQLMFLREVMKLCPTEDNLKEEGDELAPQQSSACEENTPSGPVESAPGPSMAPSRPPSASGGNSPPSLALPRQARRRAMPPAESLINTQVRDYLSRARQEDHFDLFACSLAHYLRRLPSERVLRTKSALGIVLDAATTPNDPTEMFGALENWRLHGHMFGPQPMPISQGSQPPPQLPPPRGHYRPPSRPYGTHYQVDSSYGQSVPTFSQAASSQYSGPPFPTSLPWPAVSGPTLAIWASY